LQGGVHLEQSIVDGFLQLQEEIHSRRTLHDFNSVVDGFVGSIPTSIVLGNTQSGKTMFVRYLVRKIAKRNTVLIADSRKDDYINCSVTWNWTNYAAMINKRYGAFRFVDYHNADITITQHSVIVDIVAQLTFLWPGNCVAVLEEAGKSISRAQHLGKSRVGLQNLVFEGLGLNKGYILIGQDPRYINAEMISQAQTLFLFSLGSRQREYLHRNWGIDVPALPPGYFLRVLNVAVPDSVEIRLFQPLKIKKDGQVVRKDSRSALYF